jgi:hypothetical protein
MGRSFGNKKIFPDVSRKLDRMRLVLVASLLEISRLKKFWKCVPGLQPDASSSCYLLITEIRIWN